MSPAASRPRLRAWSVGLAACCAALGPGCSHGPVDEHPPLVLLIEVDTLRADFLASDRLAKPRPARTPYLDQLAAQSQLFEAAYASAPWTQPSVATALTGLWPWQHGVTALLGRLDAERTTLAEAMSAGGFHTAGVMTNFLVKRQSGYAQGFDLWKEDLATGHEGLSAEAAVDQLLASYDTLAAGRTDAHEPIFLYGFLFEPHWRYEPTEATAGSNVASFDELADLRAALAAGQLTERDLADLGQLYAGEVERIDRALERLAAGLAERGVWDDAVVAFTADHGEHLGESTWGAPPWIGHTVDLSDPLVRVPLWIKAPGLAPGRESRPVSQVDLAATLLGLAGLEPHLGVGRSLFDPSAPPRRELYLHVDFAPALVRPDSKRKRSLMWGVVDAETRQKWVVDHLAEGGPVAHLFDLIGDPGETEDRAPGTDPLAFQSLRGLVPEPLLDGQSGAEPLER